MPSLSQPLHSSLTDHVGLDLGPEGDGGVGAGAAGLDGDGEAAAGREVAAFGVDGRARQHGHGAARIEHLAADGERN